MGVERQAQIPQRTIFALNRFDDLLVKVAPGFFTIQRQPVAYVDMLARAGNQIAFFIVDTVIQVTAVLGSLTQNLADAFVIRRFGTHSGRDVKRNLTRQRAGQLLKLRIPLPLMILAKPRRPLHQHH